MVDGRLHVSFTARVNIFGVGQIEQLNADGIPRAPGERPVELLDTQAEVVEQGNRPFETATVNRDGHSYMQHITLHTDVTGCCAIHLQNPTPPLNYEEGILTIAVLCDPSAQDREELAPWLSGQMPSGGTESRSGAQ